MEVAAGAASFICRAPASFIIFLRGDEAFFSPSPDPFPTSGKGCAAERERTSNIYHVQQKNSYAFSTSVPIVISGGKISLAEAKLSYSMIANVPIEIGNV